MGLGCLVKLLRENILYLPQISYSYKINLHVIVDYNLTRTTKRGQETGILKSDSLKSKFEYYKSCTTLHQPVFPLLWVTLQFPIGQSWEGSLCIRWPNWKQDLWILSGIFMLSIPLWNYLLIPFSKQGSRSKPLSPSPAEGLCGCNTNVPMWRLKGLLQGRWPSVALLVPK